MKCFFTLILATLVLAGSSFSQTNTYILNGSASQNSCNCYTLTPATAFQSGSVWNANKISLNTPFDFRFNVNLGCKDADGADGIVFILQPISTSVGAAGGGMGFQGVVPSIGIALDTWQNGESNDPAFDHISIQANGNLDHNLDLDGPVQASTSNPNIEDCGWHDFRITWDPVTRWLRSYFDNVLRVETQVDLIGTIFNNDPMVYWGFGAATGGSNNVQQFCTALNPAFTTNLTGSGACLGETITFTNTSSSFAPIASYHWDFGDNTTSSLATPPPHTYTAPGVYQVKLAIEGFDGCDSDTLRRTISIGDYPVAAMTIADTCSGATPRIRDASSVTVGTINNWNWTITGGPTSTSQHPQFTGLPPGIYPVTLTVESNLGCASAPASGSVTILESPVISAAASATDICVNASVTFEGSQSGALVIDSWNWKLSDGRSLSDQEITTNFFNPGTYTAELTVDAANGCKSAPATTQVTVHQAIANAGRDTVFIQNQPFQLQGTGGSIYSWSPSTGLSDPGIANPTGVLTDDITYTLTVTTPEGCVDTDEINITVFKGSQIYVPGGFTPNGDGRNEKLGPYYIGIKSVDYFQVFNRWGEQVFLTKDLYQQWDGRFRGEPQPSGVYVWQLRATDYVGKVYELKGTTTIIR